MIDAGGKLLLPGFNDAHVHFVSGGLQLDSVQLNDVASLEEFVRRIAERAKKTPKGEWIQGGDWDETKWPGSVLPTKELIDPVTPDNPVFLSRYDGHSSLANSAALKLAGVTAQTPDPPGGTIVRDAQGNPTGDLKDAATDLVAQRDSSAFARSGYAGGEAGTGTRRFGRRDQRANHGSRVRGDRCLCRTACRRVNSPRAFTPRL